MVCKFGQLAFCFMLLTNSAAFAANQEKIGVVGSMKGKVTGLLEGSSASISLKESDSIYLNETVRTGDDGAAQLMFLDKSSLTITPSSEVKIDTFVYNPQTSAGSMSVQGVKGAFRFIGGALSKNEPVTIKTPVSTIGIRGGIIQASISEDGHKTQAIFLYGREMTVTKAGASASVITQFGQGALISAAGKIQAMKPAEINAQIHGFNSSTQSGVSLDQKVNAPAKNASGTGSGKQSGKNASTGTSASTASGSGSGTTADSSNSTTSNNSGTSTTDSSGNTSTTSGTTSDSSASSTTSGSSGTSSVSGSSVSASGTITSIIAAIPPTNTYNNSSNAIVIPAVSDSSADNWGAWAQAINNDQSAYPTSSLQTIISSVTGLPSLGSDLTTLPTSFGTVSYNGSANGSITSGGSTAPATGYFSASINFNTQQLTSLNINSFMNGLGYFSLNYSGGGTQQINNVPLTGSGTGTASLAVYGNSAEVLAGRFSATSGGTTAQGVIVGHQ